MSQFLYTPPNNAPVVIYADGGGLVNNYFDKAHQYTLEGRRVEIRGSCRSACLLALSVKNVCVGPGAVVKAHHAYEQTTGAVRSDYTDRMLSELPRAVKDRLAGKIQKNYNPAATLDYSELRALGIPACGKPSTVATDRPKEMKVKLMHPFGGVLKWLGWEK